MEERIDHPIRATGCNWQLGHTKKTAVRGWETFFYIKRFAHIHVTDYFFSNRVIENISLFFLLLEIVQGKVLMVLNLLYKLITPYATYWHEN